MDKLHPEHREKPRGINLRVVPPEGDKHHMVRFDARTPEEARAYNEAIAYYLGLQYKTIFHQVGGSDDELGAHAWEIWDKDVDEQKLAALLPEIEKDSQMIINEKDFNILHEKVYKRWHQQKK